ncbi:hypothetical protein [Oceanihabitans sediminis]|nr:hypothetical protein [Oceanihabitans sediminis]MDX1278564.1 hypothetical protein [Oceanihabitans sediminis]
MGTKIMDSTGYEGAKEAPKETVRTDSATRKSHSAGNVGASNANHA